MPSSLINMWVAVMCSSSPSSLRSLNWIQFVGRAVVLLYLCMNTFQEQVSRSFGNKCDPVRRKGIETMKLWVIDVLSLCICLSLTHSKDNVMKSKSNENPLFRFMILSSKTVDRNGSVMNQRTFCSLENRLKSAIVISLMCSCLFCSGLVIFFSSWVALSTPKSIRRCWPICTQQMLIGDY